MLSKLGCFFLGSSAGVLTSIAISHQEQIQLALDSFLSHTINALDVHHNQNTPFHPPIIREPKDAIADLDKKIETYITDKDFEDKHLDLNDYSFYDKGINDNTLLKILEARKKNPKPYKNVGI